MIGLLGVCIVTALLCFPFILTIYWLGDEGILLRGGAQLVSGKRIYNDFFAFLPPGGYLIIEEWIKVFGPSFLGIRFFALLNIVGLVGFTYLSCLLTSNNIGLSLFLALAWLMTSQSSSNISIQHHWITILFSMVAFYLTLMSIDSPKARQIGAPSLAGVIAGAAAMVTSSCGLWALLATVGSFVDVRRFRIPLAACFFGGLLVPLLCLFYIVLNGEFTRAFNDIIISTLTRYSTIQAVAYGGRSPWFLPNQYVFPLAGGLALAVLIINPQKYFYDPKFRSCVLYGLAGFAGIFPRPDIYHIDITEPLALPLIGYGISRLTENWRSIYRIFLLELAIFWCLPPSVAFVHGALVAIHAPVTETALGPVSLLGHERDGGAAVFRFLANTSPSDEDFFYPYMPMMSYLAQRQQVSRYDIFAPEYTTPSHYFKACQSVVKKAKWVILDRAMMDRRTLKHIFPAMKNPDPPETLAFEQAIQKNFAFVRRVGVFEIRQRLATVDAKDCNKILSE